MTCCLCGRAFEPGDLYLTIRMRELRVIQDGSYVSSNVMLEDGSPEKLACPTCPIEHGAPLALVGADLAGGYHV